MRSLGVSLTGARDLSAGRIERSLEDIHRAADQGFSGTEMTKWQDGNLPKPLTHDMYVSIYVFHLVPLDQ